MLRYARNLITRTRTFGPSYAVVAPVRRAAELTEQWSHRQLLRIEGERGVLGPAHASWSDHAPEVDREHWGGWDRQDGGEQWSISEAWKQGLVDEVLLPSIPAGGTVHDLGAYRDAITTLVRPG